MPGMDKVEPFFVAPFQGVLALFLLEMGLVPGTEVRILTIAPLGDPLQIQVRSGQWSIRRAEAAVRFE